MGGLVAAAGLMVLAVIGGGTAAGAWLSPKHRGRGALLGAIAGAGALYGYNAYKRSQTLKALDLQLEQACKFCVEHPEQCTHTAATKQYPQGHWTPNQGGQPCYDPDYERYRAEHS